MIGGGGGGGGGGKAKACRLTYANVYAITTYVLCSI